MIEIYCKKCGKRHEPVAYGPCAEDRSELTDTLGSTTITITSNHACKHRNGWYESVRFGIFTKNVFICTDCESLRDPKTKRLV